MLNRWISLLAAAALMLAACSPLSAPEPPAAEPTPSPLPPDAPVSGGPEEPAGPAATPPYLPQPSDAALARGEVFLDETTLLSLESYPPQIVLALAGSLPTPCHQLRVAAAPPDAQNRIQVDVYSVVDPNAICIQVLESFQQSVPLGSFPAGAYTVWVNGELAGEFTS